jgi:hypothetical protein
MNIFIVEKPWPMAKNISQTDEVIINKIYVIREQKVMLDEDLATLYDVSTKVLNQSVKRNLLRFPEDFMFQLSDQEVEILRSQTVTSSWGGRRTRPYAFTEQEVAMLSSVLHSERAILVNIHIISVFMRIREMLLAHNDVLLKLKQLEGLTNEVNQFHPLR